MAKAKCKTDSLLIFSPPPELDISVKAREGMGPMLVFEATADGEFAEVPGHIAKLLGEKEAAHSLTAPEDTIRLEIPLKKLSEVKAPAPSKESG